MKLISIFSIFERSKSKADRAPSLETASPPRGDYVFNDLSPTILADQDSVYFNALHEALKRDHVRNIAITGPYSSGKSSVLASFSERTGADFVTVSLATFGEVETLDEKALGAAVEKSILQQLLYSVAAKNVPYSRLSRIVPFDRLPLKATLATMWVLLAYFYWAQETGTVWNHLRDSFTMGWSLLALIPFLFVFAGLAMLIAALLKASIGISKLKVALPGFEVESAEGGEASVLSENLDELTYFLKQRRSKLSYSKT